MVKKIQREVSSLKKTIIATQWIATFVSRIMNNIFLSPRVSGIENLLELAELKKEKGLSVIFISNHTNCNDPFVETGFLPNVVKKEVFPITFLATHERFGGKIKSTIMKLLGCIPVANGKGQNVREVLRRIKEGETIYFFPEGKISMDGGLGHDQGALEMFSKFSDFIVQPIRIDGLKHFWDLKAMFLFQRKAIVVFGRPFVLPKGSMIDAMQIITSECVFQEEMILPDQL